MLFFGTAVYNGSLKLPFLSYGDDYSNIPDRPTTPSGMRAPDSLATSALMKSPLLRRMSLEYESPGRAMTLATRATARRDAESAVAMNEGCVVAAKEGGIAGRPRALSSERQELMYGRASADVVESAYGTGL